MRFPATVAACLLTLGASGCATSAFQRHLDAGRWTDAAATFGSDSSLHRDPDALFAASTIFGTPGGALYDPERAHALLGHLVERFPGHPRAGEARYRLAVLAEVLRLRTQLQQVKDIDLSPPR